ncbi:MAG: hypothetical protein AAB634_01340 [Patescibacteria group bacterium]
MIICLYGPDSYRREEKVRELVLKYREKYAHADFLEVDLEENPEDWILARDFLEQNSLFTPSKFCLIRESGSVGEEYLKGWKEVLKSVLDSESVFAVISDSSKPIAAFDFLLKPPVKAQEFDEFSRAELGAFVLKEAGARGVKFDAPALRAFADYVSGAGERTRVAVSEIEKISLAGFAMPLSLVDLSKLISLEKYSGSYQIVTSLIRANKGYNRLAGLLELELRGDDPRYTLNLLGSVAWGEDAVALARVDEMVKGGESEDEVALTGFALGL